MWDTVYHWGKIEEHVHVILKIADLWYKAADYLRCKSIVLLDGGLVLPRTKAMNAAICSCICPTRGISLGGDDELTGAGQV